MSVSTDYFAENRRGVVIRTFDTFKAACRWVAEHADDHDGLHVVSVATTVTRRRFDSRGRFLARAAHPHHQGDQPHG